MSRLIDIHPLSHFPFLSGHPLVMCLTHSRVSVLTNGNSYIAAYSRECWTPTHGSKGVLTKKPTVAQPDSGYPEVLQPTFCPTSGPQSDDHVLVTCEKYMLCAGFARRVKQKQREEVYECV